MKDINNILIYGRKTTTYKYAVLLSIFDYIFEFPTEPSKNHFHFIPIIYLAKRFFFYYYPFCFYPNIYQGGSAGSRPRIITKISDFIEDLPNIARMPNKPEYISNIINSKENGIIYFNKWFEHQKPLLNLLIKTLIQIRKRILYQPLQYLHNVKGEEIRFFGLYNKNTHFNEDYDIHRENGMGTKFPKNGNWETLIQSEDTFLVIDELVYRELGYLRLWGRDVIIKSWLDFIVKGSQNILNITPSLLFNLFDIIYEDIFTRDPSLMQDYKELYHRINLNNCFYSNAYLKPQNIHLDHFLPWSYYPVNRFWNLVPCKNEIKLKKSNFLPEWNKKIKKAMQLHLERCVNAAEQEPLIENDLRYFYLISQKDDSDIKSKSKEEIVNDLIKHVEVELDNLAKIIPGKRFSF